MILNKTQIFIYWGALVLGYISLFFPDFGNLSHGSSFIEHIIFIAIIVISIYSALKLFLLYNSYFNKVIIVTLSFPFIIGVSLILMSYLTR